MAQERDPARWRMKRPVECELPPVYSPAGNAYVVMGVWEQAAKDAGWTDDEINATLAKAMSGDYANLRRVLEATAEDK